MLFIKNNIFFYGMNKLNVEAAVCRCFTKLVFLYIAFCNKSPFHYQINRIRFIESGRSDSVILY